MSYSQAGLRSVKVNSFVLAVPFNSFLPFVVSYISYFVAPLIAPQVIFKSLPASPLAEVVMPETLRLSVSEAPCGRYAKLQSTLPLMPRTLPLLEYCHM